MDIAVPSRFACLKIEDDDTRPASNNFNKKKPDSKVTKKPAPVAKKAAPIQAVFTPKQTSSNSKKPKGKQSDKQWEEWKKKDSEFVNDNFEQDMEAAILQSKLEFEAKKSVNGLDGSSKKNKQTNNKKKKNKPMNLAEFLEGPEKNESNGHPEEVVQQEDGDAFFEKMLEVAKKEVTKGRLEEERRERSINFEKVASLAQCQEKLKQEQERNIELQQQLDEARTEIAVVKARNKMFCTILGQGEMKDKAGILLDLERLNSVKDELTEELTRLNKLLEQERSKTAALIADSQSLKHKDKKRKKNGS